MLEWGRKSAGIVSVLQDGFVVAQVRQAAMRERAGVAIGSSQWQFYRQRGDLHAVSVDGTFGMTASPTKIFGVSWDICTGTHAYRMEPMGLFKSGRRVLCAGTPVGSSDRVGWSRRPTLDVDASIPVEHQVFLLWVLYIIGRRSSGGPGASGGGDGGA